MPETTLLCWMPGMLVLDYALPVCSLAVHVSNVSACSCRRSWPHIPVVSIPEDLTVKIALSLKYEINRSLAVLREIALGRDLKKFLAVIAGLWICYRSIARFLQSDDDRDQLRFFEAKLLVKWLLMLRCTRLPQTIVQHFVVSWTTMRILLNQKRNSTPRIANASEYLEMVLRWSSTTPCFKRSLVWYGRVFITLHTVPFLYDKHEDQVDAFGEKAAAKFKKHYAVVHAKYLSKIPKGPLKDKKSHDALETYCIFWCWAMTYLSDRRDNAEQVSLRNLGSCRRN
ncbi:hypothetical protein ZIOFF_024487 [Zingiber officinale]|uniref:Reticulon-like protein n=1 Tax=Zingiber officinale TaxID=94328 RepID=A0A8J5H0I1_ZINOF|nr:hypothetical protein ZIOFF_024487 [Zingiber officinale]